MKTRIMPVAVFLMAMTGCARKVYVPVESSVHESAGRVSGRTDTVVITDTRVVYVRGDTVIDRQIVERDRVSVRVDTVCHERVDTVVRAVGTPSTMPRSPVRRLLDDWLVPVAAGVALGLFLRFRR